MVRHLVSRCLRADRLGPSRAWFLGAVAVFATSCGAPKLNAPPSPKAAGSSVKSADGTPASNCVAGACPATSSQIGATFASPGQLLALVGQPVAWEFYGIDADTVNEDGLSSVRRVTVLLDKIPSGSAITPAVKKESLAVQAQIVWTPAKEGSGAVDVIVRDQERCELLENAASCQQYAFLKDYDTRFAGIKWEVMNQEAYDAMIAQTTAEDPAPSETPDDKVCAAPAAAPAAPVAVQEAPGDVTSELIKGAVMVAKSPTDLKTIFPTVLGNVLTSAFKKAVPAAAPAAPVQPAPTPDDC